MQYVFSLITISTIADGQIFFSGLTRTQLDIFDSLAPQTAEDGSQPENPENGVPRFELIHIFEKCVDIIIHLQIFKLLKIISRYNF